MNTQRKADSGSVSAPTNGRDCRAELLCFCLDRAAKASSAGAPCPRGVAVLSTDSPDRPRAHIAPWRWLRILPLAVGSLLIGACAPEAQAENYYVDFEAGSDAAQGTSPEQAWKHAPGDALATGRPRAVKLSPGDRVRFRGGVAYRGGQITLQADGAPDAPIVYAGDEWGDQPAIFDGSDLTDPPTPCPSSAACGGAPNWSNLSQIRFTPPQSEFIKLFDSNGPMFESQFPSPKDPFFSDDVLEYAELPQHVAAEATQGSIRAPSLVQALKGGWDGAEISIWNTGNEVVRRKIDAIEGDRIRFASEGIRPYRDRPGRFAVVNAAVLIDRPGAYAMIGPGLAIAWLRPGPGGQSLSVGNGRKAIDIRGKSHIAISGFVFEHFSGKKFGEGFQVMNSRALSRDVLIENNVFRRSALYSGSGAVTIGNVDGARIVGNRFSDLERGSGIRTHAKPISNLEIRGNSFDRLGRTGILVMGASNVTIANNSMRNLYGIHGNGISLYLDNNKISVVRNTIFNATRPMTFHGDRDFTSTQPHDITIDRNTFTTTEPSAGALISFGDTKGVTITNNVLIGPKIGLILSATDSGLVVTGNSTSSITTKGAQPADWVMRDNRPLTRDQRKTAEREAEVGKSR